jgi:hypothetical protein
MLVKRYFPSHFFRDGHEHVCAAIIGLSLVYQETLVAIKPSVANDAVNYLGKATIELRNWTRRRGRATAAPAKLRLCSRPNSPAKWDSRDAILYVLAITNREHFLSESCFRTLRI